MSYDPLADFDAEITHFLQAAGQAAQSLPLLHPPDRDFGERAVNVAPLSREQRRAPQDIARDIAWQFNPAGHRFIAAAEPAGSGFINFRLNYAEFIPFALRAIEDAGSLYGRRPDVPSQHIIVEHTSVNPNKEWHIGHVRNVVLGDVVSRVLRRQGHDVEVQNYIDDTGLQAAQAALGLTDFPEEQRPNEKFDHYIGRLYVKIAGEVGAERRLREQLLQLESGDAVNGDDQADIESLKARLDNIQRLQRRLLEIMHSLEKGDFYFLTEKIVQAQLETAERLGVYYDLLNWESHLVSSGLVKEAMRLLESSPRVRRPEEGRYAGALVIQIRDETETEEAQYEVLLRSSGLPTYIAKDIPYHMWKFHVVPDRLRYVEFSAQGNGQPLWSTALEGEKRPNKKPAQVINVIGVNQSLAQAAVKEGLRAAGFEQEADRLVHLAYGLVSMGTGRISGRKGTGTAGDTVIDEAVQAALERAHEKRSQDFNESEMQEIAEAVGVGALRYFMVQYNPAREIVFDVAKVVSYDGNTGLYIQYALVRAFAILRRAIAEPTSEKQGSPGLDLALLQHVQERRLVYHMTQYPAVIADAARTLSVNLVAEFAFDLASLFSQFYRDCTVLNADPPALRTARLYLVRTVKDVLSNACDVLGIPVIEHL